jgi:hypothetical protein
MTVHHDGEDRLRTAWQWAAARFLPGRLRLASLAGLVLHAGAVT